MALVTGAGVQLGREIALGLARAGYDICVHYGRSADGARRTVADVEAMGRRAVAVEADFSCSDAAMHVIPKCRKALGTPEVLVNSASLFEHDTGKDFDHELFQRAMSINLAAPLILARAMYAAHIEEGRKARAGVIINILDQKLYALNPDHLSYTLSKAALATATTMLAQAFAPAIRTAGVAPGLTMKHPDQPMWEFEQAQKATPLRRGPSPHDITQAVVFIARNEGINDTTLVVDCGQHLMRAERDTMYAFKD